MARIVNTKHTFHLSCCRSPYFLIVPIISAISSGPSFFRTNFPIEIQSRMSPPFFHTDGIFNDNTHTYTAAATDAMNYQIVTGSTGTSISISFMEVYGNASAAPTGPTYRSFGGKQRYNPFGAANTMVIFG
jgi:hypothetical protein